MKLTNKTFDVLKWVAMIVIPAIATFTGVVGQSVGWSSTDVAVTIITAVGALLGTILGVSNGTYKKEDK